jgi:hypothetical protein
LSRIYATFDGKENGPNLGESCLGLLAEQKAVWPQLSQAYEALESAKTRDLACNGFSVRLLHNPERLTSTAAKVDAADIRRRPCFLCEHQLPDLQRAILYRDEYLILPNPMPVTFSHLTIPHVSHKPQAITANIQAFLTLAADFGRQWLILYNGPRCGASAPDHLHFQAIPAGQTPIERETQEKRRLVPYGGRQNGVLCYRVEKVGRETILFAGKKRELLAEALSRHIETLSEITRPPAGEEPMISVTACFEDGEYRVLVFPRQRHRPSIFFKEGDDRIVVSPAVVEMAGIIVTPFEKDFRRLNAKVVETIYQEVSLDLGPADSD